MSSVHDTPVFYVQHGSDNGPFITERVDGRRAPNAVVPRSGPIPSNFQVKVAGRWRRVWTGSLGPHVLVGGNPVRVTVERGEE